MFYSHFCGKILNQVISATERAILDEKVQTLQEKKRSQRRNNKTTVDSVEFLT